MNTSVFFFFFGRCLTLKNHWQIHTHINKSLIPTWTNDAFKSFPIVFASIIFFFSCLFLIIIVLLRWILVDRWRAFSYFFFFHNSNLLDYYCVLRIIIIVIYLIFTTRSREDFSRLFPMEMLSFLFHFVPNHYVFIVKYFFVSWFYFGPCTCEWSLKSPDLNGKINLFVFHLSFFQSLAFSFCFIKRPSDHILPFANCFGFFFSVFAVFVFMFGMAWNPIPW